MPASPGTKPKPPGRGGTEEGVFGELAASASWFPTKTHRVADVCLLLRALLRHAAKITVFEPSDPRVKDISDFFAYGHSEVELIAAMENQEVNQWPLRYSWTRYWKPQPGMARLIA